MVAVPVASVTTPVPISTLGHNFDGAHWEADQGDVMWPVLDLISNPRFSDGSVDPNRNNKKRICTNMTSRGFSFVCP